MSQPLVWFLLAFGLGVGACGNDGDSDGDAAGAAGAGGTGGQRAEVGGTEASGGNLGRGGGPVTGGSPGAGGEPTSACTDETFTGPGTFYDWADGFGICHFEPETGAQMVVALNKPQLGVAAMCGACIHARGPTGEATVLVVNGCPECPTGHLDFSPEAYEIVAGGHRGIPEITWQFVPCPVTGDIRFHYFEGSTVNWAWVHVRNHRHAIASSSTSTGPGRGSPPSAKTGTTSR